MDNLDTQKDHLTDLLHAWSLGEKAAFDELLPYVETELRRIAHNYMRQEENHHTLQTTALINEAYLKLIDVKVEKWQDRTHFFALAARIMRRILISHARKTDTIKRGGGLDHVEINEIVILDSKKSVELIALNEALEKMAEFDDLKHQIIELRYFGGLSIKETADALKISPVTVSAHWRLARAWLAKEIKINLNNNNL